MTFFHLPGYTLGWNGFEELKRQIPFSFEEHTSVIKKPGRWKTNIFVFLQNAWKSGLKWKELKKNSLWNKITHSTQDTIWLIICFNGLFGLEWAVPRTILFPNGNINPWRNAPSWRDFSPAQDSSATGSTLLQCTGWCVESVDRGCASQLVTAVRRRWVVTLARLRSREGRPTGSHCSRN